MDPNELFPWLVGGGTFVTVLTVIVSVCCSIFLPLGIVGGLGYYIYTRSQKAKAVQQAAQAWLTTQGQIVLSRVEVSGGETTSVSPRVVYQYQVGAQMYQSETIRAGSQFFSITTSRGAYDTVDRYPVGKTVTVYYNPANPAEAALER
ncbi:MAG: hypothetical protein Fur0022_32210 [Anaerolineales bacterium]